MGPVALLLFKSVVQGVGEFLKRSQSRLTPNFFDGKLIPVTSMACDRSLTPAAMVIAKRKSYLTLRLPELVAHILPQRQRLDALLAVMGWIVHPCANGVDLHLLGGIRGEEREELRRFLDRRIEPETFGLSGQDHRHAVVDGLQEVVRFGCNDGARADLISFGRNPLVPEPCEPKRLPALENDIHRLLPPTNLLPLIEAVSHHEAPPLAVRDSEGGLHRQRLGAGVDHAIPNDGVLRPRRNEPPLHLDEVSLPVVANHDHSLRGRDVVAWRRRDPLVCHRVNAEASGDGLEIHGAGEPTAHLSASYAIP